MPQAEENLPGATSQAMAWHYAPKVCQAEVTVSQQRRQQRRAMSGLPDLSDRLKKLGMFESYKAWSENYANWRSGAATGAKGEVTSAIQNVPLKAGPSKASPKGLRDLSEHLRQSGTYEAYQAWSRGYNQWRKGSAKGAKGELTSNPAKRMSRASTKKVDWPEASECLPTAEGQAMLFHHQPQVQKLPSVPSVPSGATAKSRALPNHLQKRQPQPRLPVSRPHVSWPEAEENLPGAHSQAMACHFQPQAVLAR